ncbi:hypothetical protein MAR_010631, partial [Mya arenaria]
LAGGVKFIPFPKPRTKLENCLRWIKACGRPHEQLNTNTINGNYHMFVCTEACFNLKNIIDVAIFQIGGLSADFHDPTPADSCAVQQATLARRPPKRRHELEPVPIRRIIFAQIDISNPINDEKHPPTTTYEYVNLNAHPKPSSTETVPNKVSIQLEENSAFCKEHETKDTCSTFRLKTQEWFSENG